jgi:hypothetical protein
MIARRPRSSWLFRRTRAHDREVGAFAGEIRPGNAPNSRSWARAQAWVAHALQLAELLPGLLTDGWDGRLRVID